KEEEKIKQDKPTVDSSLKADSLSSANVAPKSNKKLSYKEQKELEHLQKEIAELEEEKVQITEKMSDPNLSFETMQQYGERITTISQALEEKEMRWLELELKMEQ